MVNIAVLVSGGGTICRAMLDAKARGKSPTAGSPAVIASNPKAYALERAKLQRGDGSAGAEGIFHPGRI